MSSRTRPHPGEPVASTSLLLVLVFCLGTAPRLAAQEARGIELRHDGPEPGGRTALVVGNSAYGTGPLPNPANDAADMAEALREASFDVMLRLDADREEMDRAVREFGRRLRGAGTGLFYYAGHGIQSDGSNFLIPVDAELRHEKRLPFETVQVREVMAEMEAAGNPFNIVILDACRNNPFARSFRSASRGLARTDAPTGTFIAYATAPGQVASDGDGRNGLYTRELLRYLEIGGLSINQVFDRTRLAVYRASGGGQVPWVSTSLMGSFYFRDGDGELPDDLAPVRLASAASAGTAGGRGGAARGTGAVVTVLGDEQAARRAETSILRSMVRAGELVPVDVGALSLDGESDAARAALAGDFSGLSSLGRRHSVEFFAVGRLHAEAVPSVAGFFTGTAELELRLYRVSTSSLVEADFFRVGAGSKAGELAVSPTLARSRAAEEVGRAAARAVRRWVRQASRSAGLRR